MRQDGNLDGADEWYLFKRFGCAEVDPSRAAD